MNINSSSTVASPLPSTKVVCVARRAMLCFLLVSALICFAGPTRNRPFILPISAKATEHSKDGKGWLESGVITVPFVQAEASFRAAMAQSGWKFLHAVALAKNNVQTLYTWRRGGRELTLMLRRINVNKTAFSWGLAAVGK